LSEAYFFNNELQKNMTFQYEKYRPERLIMVGFSLLYGIEMSDNNLR